MEIAIEEWDFNLGHYSQPVPMVTFTPTLDFLEIMKRNNNRVWVTVGKTGHEGLDGNSFLAAIDVSMANNPCKGELSPSQSIYTATLIGAQYPHGVSGGVLTINRPISDAPPVVADPLAPGESYVSRVDEADRKVNKGLDAVSLALLAAAVAVAFALTLVASRTQNEVFVAAKQ